MYIILKIKTTWICERILFIFYLPVSLVLEDVSHIILNIFILLLLSAEQSLGSFSRHHLFPSICATVVQNIFLQTTAYYSRPHYKSIGIKIWVLFIFIILLPCGHYCTYCNPLYNPVIAKPLISEIFCLKVLFNIILCNASSTAEQAGLFLFACYPFVGETSFIGCNWTCEPGSKLSVTTVHRHSFG